MASPDAVNTKDPGAVITYARDLFAELWPATDNSFVDRVFTEITQLFTGRFPGYLGIDMGYHNFEHTLQATVCLLEIVRGRHHAGVTPVLSRRDAELGVAAALLHDSGFIKRSDDAAGTGAKYTLVHEKRSCDFARSYLASRGATVDEIEDVCAAISCTGTKNRIGAYAFRRPAARMIACILVTADYLAQMSAADYAEKLTVLFREFVEAYEFEGVPVEQRPYQSALELAQKTPTFWEKLVRPMLEIDADSVYRFLANTGQPNLYLQAVEANIEKIRRRSQSGLVST